VINCSASFAAFFRLTLGKVFSAYVLKIGFIGALTSVTYGASNFFKTQRRREK
jgi:hypothetical protein